MIKYAILILITTFSLSAGELDRLVTSKPLPLSSRLAARQAKIIEKKLAGDLKKGEKISYLKSYVVLKASQGDLKTALGSIDKLLLLTKDIDSYKIYRTLKLQVMFSIRQQFAGKKPNEALALDRLLATYLALYLEKGTMLEKTSKSKIRSQKRNLILTFLAGRFLEYDLNLDSKVPLVFEDLLFSAIKQKRPYSLSKIKKDKEDIALLQRILNEKSINSSLSREKSVIAANFEFLKNLNGNNKIRFMENHKSYLHASQIKMSVNINSGKKLEEVFKTLANYSDSIYKIAKTERASSDLGKNINDLKSARDTMKESIKAARRNKNSVHMLHIPDSLDAKTKDELISRRDALKYSVQKYQSYKDYYDKVIEYNNKSRTLVEMQYEETDMKLRLNLRKAKENYERVSRY